MLYRRARICRNGLACALAGLAVAGCHSLPGHREPPEAALHEFEQSPEFADALAAFSRGRLFEYRGEDEQAVEAYRKSIELDPGNRTLYLHIATLLIQLDRQDEAIETMQTLVRRDPEAVEPLQWMATVYRASGRVPEAASTYQRLIDLQPGTAEPVVKLASLFLRNDREDRALSVLHKYRDSVDDPVDIYRFLAGIYGRRASGESDPKDADRARKQALKYYQLLSRHDPDNAAAHLYAGDLALDLEKPDLAVTLFEKASRLRPDDPDMQKKLALGYVAAGEREKAIEALEASLDEEAPTTPVLLLMGELYEKLGDTENAALNYELAAQADSEHAPKAYMRLALLLMDEDPARAEEVLEEALGRYPDHPRLHEMSGFLFLHEESYDRALTHFDRAAETFDDLPDESPRPNFHFYHAVTAQQAGHPGAAATNLVRAADNNPAFINAYAQFLFQREDDADRRTGIPVLQRVARLLGPPHKARVYMFTGLLHKQLGEDSDAVEAFEKARALAVEHGVEDDVLTPRFYFWYGAATEQAGDFEAAVPLFETCIELDPDHAQAYNYLAYMWAERGIHLEKALRYIRKGLEMRPESGAFIDTLGWIYYRMGRYEEALEQIRRADQVVPDDPTITDHLGDVHKALGHTDHALRFWKEAYRLDPSNEDLAAKLQEHGVSPASLEDDQDPAGKAAPADPAPLNTPSTAR